MSRIGVAVKKRREPKYTVVFFDQDQESLLGISRLMASKTTHENAEWVLGLAHENPTSSDIQFTDFKGLKEASEKEDSNDLFIYDGKRWRYANPPAIDVKSSVDELIDVASIAYAFENNPVQRSGKLGRQKAASISAGYPH